MRLFITTIALLSIVSCQNNEKISDVISEKRDTVAVVEAPNNQGLNATNTPHETSTSKTAKDKVVFSNNGNDVITFNTVSNVGVAHINGKTYPLNQMLFEESTYTLSGKGIEIILEDGDFDTDNNSCLTGEFPKMTVDINGTTTTFDHIKVKDCTN